jgi:hypothetical protein
MRLDLRGAVVGVDVEAVATIEGAVFDENGAVLVRFRAVLLVKEAGVLLLRVTRLGFSSLSSSESSIKMTSW